MREAVNSHQEKTWVLCLSDAFDKKPLTPLLDLIDWYNNQLLTKSILGGHVKLGFGDKTLMATSGLLAAQRLIIMGLGKSDQLTAAQARKFLQDLGQTLASVNESHPWIVVAADTPGKFTEEIEKSRTSISGLSRATISIG